MLKNEISENTSYTHTLTHTSHPTHTSTPHTRLTPHTHPTHTHLTPTHTPHTPHTPPTPHTLLTPHTHSTHRFIVPAMSKVSFLNRTLTHTQKMSRISEYYKFMMIRDPLERLVSAYRDKMAAPLMAGYENQFPDKIKLAILERYMYCTCKTTVRCVDNNVVFIMPRCSCASEVYGSVCVCLSVCLCVCV